MSDLELLVTLWPTFPHFERFATDSRLAGVRLNTAMVKAEEIGDALVKAQSIPNHVPLWFDVKGRQLRITEVIPNGENLEVILNHPIEVKTPAMVLFKAGEDYALLDKVVDGNHLIFSGGPKYMVYSGESLHIRDPSLKVNGPLFTENEIEKIRMAREAGFDRFFLSYVECQNDIEEYRKYVGDSQIIAKIENKKGLDYVANEYKKQENLAIIVARGDLYVEVDKPHHILDAMRLLISKDKEAYMGSRLMLSVIHNEVPSAADLSEIAWCYDLGYRRMLLCDELCLKEELLSRAVNVLDAFKNDYCTKYGPSAGNPKAVAHASPTNPVEGNEPGKKSLFAWVRDKLNPKYEQKG